MFQVVQYLLDKSFVLDEESMYEASLRIEPKVPNWWGSWKWFSLLLHISCHTHHILYSCTWLWYLLFCTVDGKWHKALLVYVFCSLLLPWCQLLLGFFFISFGYFMHNNRGHFGCTQLCLSWWPMTLFCIILYCVDFALSEHSYCRPLFSLLEFYWWLSFSANNVAL